MPLADIGGYLQHDYIEPREEVYTIAISRTCKPHHSSHSEDDMAVVYELANHITQLIAERRDVHTQSVLETCLYEHIERWKSDTRHWSSMIEMLAHPSYLAIVGMSGQLSKFEVARALLQELQAEPDYWFDALAAITREDPVLEEHNFDEAVNAWLEWGHKKGII